MKCKSTLRVFGIRCQNASGHSGPHTYRSWVIGTAWRRRGQYRIQWLKTR